MAISRQHIQNQIQAISIIFLLVLNHCCAMPYGSNDNDIDGNYQGSAVGGLSPRPVDYHTFVGHFKDFFMYLPVMMTTIKETMSGFPKFAEGMRILTSVSGRAEGEDCKCNANSLSSSSEVLEKSRKFD